eukprot:4881454-Alexandrium_andersonii.AAC.1
MQGTTWHTRNRQAGLRVGFNLGSLSVHPSHSCLRPRVSVVLAAGALDSGRGCGCGFSCLLYTSPSPRD